MWCAQYPPPRLMRYFDGEFSAIALEGKGVEYEYLGMSRLPACNRAW